MHKSLLALTIAVPALATGVVGYALPHPAPQSCIDAIAAADDTLSKAKSALTAAGDGFDAIGRFDLSSLRDITTQMQDMAKPMRESTDRYLAAKEECK